ncbi:MAG: hypothetical protein IKZ06_03575, partial [Oscillospiraceae bacterium]|nr:hypothetical protein [Oscillospiraceae bacterium]
IEWIITSSVLIAVIAVLRFLLRGKISLKLQYALWGLVLVRLLIPFSIFESSVSVLNLMNQRAETTMPPVYYEPYTPETSNPSAFDEDIYILDDYAEQISPETNIIVDDSGFVTEPEINVISAKDILIPIWIGGTIVFGAVFTVSNLRFSKKLKDSRQYVHCKTAWLPVYVTSAIKTPCLFGTFKPSVYVTEEVLQDEKTLFHVIEHEMTHYNHGDHIWSVLRCFCLAFHWYNPLVWLAAFLSMRDSELACDEDTIKRIGESERIEYGKTLINLTCEKPAVGILSAATTMTGSKSSIKERVLLIAKKPKMLWITAILVAVIAFVAIGCTFTGAVKYNPKTTDEPAVETFSNTIEPELSGLDGRIKMAVTEVSLKGITTEIYNGTSEDIRYRISYSLYFEKDGNLYVLPKINDNDEFDFGIKIIESGKTGIWESDTKEIYGKLPDGKYCINRTVNFGDMEFTENEFYVIGAEFTLSNGKLVYEVPSSLEKGNYEIKKQIFLNFASSNLEIPKYTYQITENTFSVFDIASETEIISVPVPEWKWEEFPYSAEEWKNLFIATETIPFPNISEYRSRYYQPLDENYFIASLDGELWLVELTPVKPASEENWVWSIYEIIPAERAESEEYFELDYDTAVKELGYTEEQLAYIEGFIEEGLSPLAIVDPIKYSKAFGKTTWPEDKSYSLGSFYFDPELFEDYGGPIGFIYIRKDGKIKIVPETADSFAFTNWDIVDSKTFYYGGNSQIRIYNIDDLSAPAVTWSVPEEKLLNKDWSPILTSASSKQNSEIFVIWVNRPEDYDTVFRGKNIDKTNYMITILDSEGKVIGEYDTGIKIRLYTSGMSDVVYPEI